MHLICFSVGSPELSSRIRRRRLKKNQQRALSFLDSQGKLDFFTGSGENMHVWVFGVNIELVKV